MLAQGRLPEAWSANGAFSSLRLLALDLNWRITGPLTNTWGTAGSSMRKLEVITLG